MTAPRPIDPDGLSRIVGGYDAILCDVWGVLHNGVAAFPAAVDALTRARAAGLPVVLVTNAPRPHPPVIDQLVALGVGRAAFDAVVTSGDVTRGLVADRAERPVYHLGPERDRPLFDGLPVRFAGLGEAGAIVATGLFDDETETAEDYRAPLTDARDRGLPLICANPDLVVDRGGRLVPCAGALAALYADLGGEVLMAGKPHAPIYERARAALRAILARDPDRERTLVIGDGARTDLAGGVAQGYPVLFLTGGISALDGSRADLAALFETAGGTPDHVAADLIW